MLQIIRDVLRIKADLQHSALGMLQITSVLLQISAPMLQVKASGAPAIPLRGPGKDRVLQNNVDLLQVKPRGELALPVLLQVEAPRQPGNEVLMHITGVRKLPHPEERARNVRLQPRTGNLQQNERVLLQVRGSLLQIGGGGEARKRDWQRLKAAPWDG